MEESISCPYCGEYIKSITKKCRFCGEWLVDGQATPQEKSEYKPVEVAETLEVTTVTDNNDNLPSVNSAISAEKVQGELPPSAPSMPGQATQTIGGQPVVVNVMNHQTVEQTVQQNQTVIVTKDKEEDGAPGWFYGEMLLIAGVIGIMTKSWWWFFGSFIGGSILIAIPFIGHIICVILGLFWGVLAGAFCAGLFDSDVAGWVIGIFVALGATAGHLEARKKHIEDN